MELVLDSGNFYSLGAPTLRLRRRDWLIDNVAFHFAGLAAKTGHKLEGRAPSVTWTDPSQLSAEEQSFAQKLHCDLLQSTTAAPLRVTPNPVSRVQQAPQERRTAWVEIILSMSDRFLPGNHSLGKRRVNTLPRPGVLSTETLP